MPQMRNVLRLSHACQYTVTSCQQPAIVPRPTSVSYGRNGVNAAISVYVYSIVIQSQIGTLKKYKRQIH